MAKRAVKASRPPHLRPGAQRALREAHQRAEMLARFPEENPNPVLRVAADGSVLYRNPAAAALPGWDCQLGHLLPKAILPLVGEAIALGNQAQQHVPLGERVYFVWVVPFPREGYANVYGIDVTEAKQAELERNTTAEFLRLVNESTGTRELIEAATRFFQERSGCQAVGIRLREGDDYPYYEARGFSEKFLREASWLCSRDAAGRVVRDGEGNPLLKHTCGGVICGRYDPSRPCFTAEGSFWTNSTTELRAGAEGRGEEARPLRHCWDEGFESVALAPLRVGGELLGLLHLADRRKGMFTLETVALWERLACQLAVAISRTRTAEALRGSQRDLSRAQAVAHTGSWRLDVGRNELRWSDETHRIFGIPVGTPLTYEAFLAAVHPGDRDFVDRSWQAALRGEPYDIEHRIVVGAEVKWVRERAELEFDAQSALLGGFGTVQDITERKRAEEALETARAQALSDKNRLEALMQALPVGVAVVDAGGGHVQGNAAYEQVWGSPRPAAHSISDYAIYKAWWCDSGEPVRPDDWASARAVQRGETVVGQLLEIERFDGTRAFVSNCAAPIRDAHGQVVGSAVAIMDVTALRQAEEALAKSRRRAEILAETAVRLLASREPQRVVEELCRKVMDFLDCQVFFNFLVEERAGRLRLNACAGIPEAEARNIEWLDFGVAVCGCAARDGCRIVAEDVQRTPDPRTELVKSFGVQAYACHPLTVQERVIGTLSFGTRSRPRFSDDELAMMASVADLVAIAMNRIQAEERIRASLREKEVLLKEVHHRVKNNMQIISSLVGLQADALADSAFRGVFEDLRDRVRSMALVHEKLYQSESLAQVEFAQYARSLLTYLWRAHGDAAAGVRLTLELQPVWLSVEAAVPCGLILNELAVNALKHAFPNEDAETPRRVEGSEGEEGEREKKEGREVRVTLRAGPEGRVSLGVGDNGVGLPPGLDWRRGRSLGLRTVQMLTGQLGAAVEVRSARGGGTHFEILWGERRDP